MDEKDLLKILDDVNEASAQVISLFHAMLRVLIDKNLLTEDEVANQLAKSSREINMIQK